MKQKYKFRNKAKTEGLRGPWAPTEAWYRDQLLHRVRYVGSHEHKVRPIHQSYDLKPALRSDASRCPTEITRDEAHQVLLEAIRRGCVSSETEPQAIPIPKAPAAGTVTPEIPFPRYAWGRLGGVLFRPG